MDYNRIAVRYAKALLKAAKENKSTDKIYADLQQIKSVAKMQDMQVVLNTPVYQATQKKAVFKAIFENKIQKLSLQLLFLLAEKNRANLLQAIIRNYEYLYRKEKNISSVELITAHKADDNFIKEVKNIIEKKFNTTAEFQYRQDKTILGGFIVNIEGKQLDAGVKSKLENYRQNLKN